ncbi:MAG: hypothetical protein MMC23_003319 [Stictis urceolatum]|nr:hypothetical protein [Stictis urceolata]
MARVAGGKKFSKLDVKRVYFGNWLRDYSQAVDVGAVKYVSAEAVRLLLWVLGFMRYILAFLAISSVLILSASFGYGSGPFEVTRDRLGCYRPEEHIDNPKDYADNLDARQYDRRLRGPVDEQRELAIDTRTGLKHYIATEDIGITTSAGLVRNLYGRAIELGRQYARSERKEDLYEAFRLLGTANHCLEDYAAHSNYVELALIELGERDVFPHVGRSTQVQLPGARHSVYPIVTGTFGGTDFLHSVMGELSDKTTQSEIEELEGTISGAQSNQQDFSLLKDLLNKVPDGLFGGKDEAGKADELQMNAQAAHMENTHISPREPEAWATQIGNMFKEIYPIIEWHDEVMESINEMIEKIPILPELLEQLTEQVNVFVFSLIAPFVLPVINQVKNELATGSSEIINSSREAQHNVFRDDYCTDPTHSMLSKDHFSNILNEPAGKTSSQVLKWVVPQIMAAWDDERVDIGRTLNRIIHGVFHHPAQREYGDDGAVDGRQAMFMIVEQWWGSKDESEKDYTRQQLSREGVEQGMNHKEGVHDSGHGCGKPLGMPTSKTAASSGAIGGLPLGNVLGQIGSALEGNSQYDSGASYGGGGGGGGGSSGKIGEFAEEAVGGGALGGIVGGLAAGIGGSFLGGLGGSEKQESRQYESYGDDGSYTKGQTEFGYNQSGSGGYESNYSRTSYPQGGMREESRYEQTSGGYVGGSSYEERTETRYESSYTSEYRQEGTFGEDSYGSRRRSRSGSGSRHSSRRRRRSRSGSEKSSSPRRGYRREEESFGGSGGGYGGSNYEERGGSYESERFESGGGGGGYEERVGRGGDGYGDREEFGDGGGEYEQQEGYGSNDSYGRSGGDGGDDEYGERQY